MKPLKLPYPRPESLSDPLHDFTEEMLDEIIGTPDQEMTWWHYQQILGPFLPAGTYEEAAYFLPLAFDHILEHDDDALDLVTSLAWFISEYSARLESDGALEASRKQMRDCLEHWAGSFEVTHFSNRACADKQWQLRYFDHVEHSETLAEGTCDLVRFTVNADLAIDFYRWISREGAGPTAAAWFLEFARRHYADEVRKPPTHGEIRRLLEDASIAERSAREVSSGLEGFVDRPSYWRDTFNLLGIESVPTPEWTEP